MKTIKKTLAIILTVIMAVTSIPMATGLISSAADCSVVGHDYGDWFINIEATCTKEGVESRFCSVCNHQESRYTDKLEHTYSSEVTESTCLEGGYTTYTCTGCGDTYTDDEKDALGHKFGEWTTVTESTCTEKGEEARICSRCSKNETREVETIAHDYALTEVEPTCLTEGYTAYKCTACPDYYIISKTDALGHSYGEWTVEKEATCEEEGKKSRICSVCQDVETVTIIKADHIYKTEIVSPTCTDDGYIKYTCSACNVSVVNKSEAIGHRFSRWAETKAATCTELGQEERTCSACGKHETRTISKIKHSYITEETKPTCTTTGRTTYICSACDYSTSVVVAATGHKLSDWIETVAPTCTTKGIVTRNCTDCGGEEETREVPVISHPYVAVYTPATCTTGSYTTYTCSVCSDTVKVDASEAKGHSDGNNDGACDACGVAVPKKDPSEDCDCMCHKGGFMGLIYKIVSIFWKLFKTNPECECGVSHY